MPGPQPLLPTLLPRRSHSHQHVPGKPPSQLCEKALIKRLTGSDEVAGKRCLSGLQMLIKQLSQVSMRVARGSASWLSSHGRGLGPRDALKKSRRRGDTEASPVGS